MAFNVTKSQNNLTLMGDFGVMCKMAYTSPSSKHKLRLKKSVHTSSDILETYWSGSGT